MSQKSNSLPPAAGEAAHQPTLEVRFDDRHNRADIYVGNLLIGEAYTGGKNPSTPERIEWAKAVRACNAYDSDQRKIAALASVVEEMLDPKAMGRDIADRARAALALAKEG